MLYNRSTMWGVLKRKDAQMKKDNKGRKLQKGERQLKTGRYEYRYTDPDGLARSIYSWRLTDTDVTPRGKKDTPPLRKQEAKIVEQLSRGANYYSTEKATVNDVFDRFINCSAAKATTKAAYARKYRIYIADAFAKRTIGSIVKSDILKWISALERKNLAPNSINDALVLLKSIFNFAVNDGLLERNPAYKIRVRRDDEEEAVKALTVEEQNLVMSGIRRCAPESLRRITEILIGTGLRISELLALTWKDIDFRNGKIVVNKSVYYGKLYGETKTRSHILPPKSRTSNRVVPMSDAVRSVFKEMYDEQTLRGFCNVEIDGHNGFIFCTLGGKLQTRTYIDAAFNNFVEKYNSSHPDECLPHLHAHMFRHTFVTRAIEAGIPPKTVSVLVGHSDMSTTLEIYTHVTDDSKRKSIDAIGKYMESIYA